MSHMQTVGAEAIVDNVISLDGPPSTSSGPERYCGSCVINWTAIERLIG
jgi:hypothetical protein